MKAKLPRFIIEKSKDIYRIWDTIKHTNTEHKFWSKEQAATVAKELEQSNR